MSQIGNIYGQALYGLAKEENLSDVLLGELTVLEQSFREEPQFLRLLSAPNITVPERCRIIDECFRGKVHQYILNFLWRTRFCKGYFIKLYLKMISF